MPFPVGPVCRWCGVPEVHADFGDCIQSLTEMGPAEKVLAALVVEVYGVSPLAAAEKADREQREAKVMRN